MEAVTEKITSACSSRTAAFRLRDRKGWIAPLWQVSKSTSLRQGTSAKPGEVVPGKTRLVILAVQVGQGEIVPDVIILLRRLVDDAVPGEEEDHQVVGLGAVLEPRTEIGERFLPGRGRDLLVGQDFHLVDVIQRRRAAAEGIGHRLGVGHGKAKLIDLGVGVAVDAEQTTYISGRGRSAGSERSTTTSPKAAVGASVPATTSIKSLGSVGRARSH